MTLPVLYDTVQTLTAAEQAQARSNIGGAQRRLFHVSKYNLDGSGTTNTTTAFKACLAAAAAANGWVVFNGDEIALIGEAGGTTIPAGLKGIISNGAILKIDPSITYTGSKIILTCAADNCDLSGLRISCDNVAFANAITGAGCTMLQINAERVKVTDFEFYGRAQSFLYITKGYADASGKIYTTGASLRGVFAYGGSGTYIYGVNVHDVSVVGSNTFGMNHMVDVPLTMDRCIASWIDECFVFGSSAGFGISAANCFRSSISNNKTMETFLEGVQATVCSEMTIAQNTLFWSELADGLRIGNDMGISIDGCTKTLVTDNIIRGAFASGVGCAADSGNSHSNVIRNNLAYNCAYEGGTYVWAYVCYTSSLPGRTYTNTNNEFDSNRYYNDTGRYTTNGYYEYVGGSGGALTNNKVRFHDGSGATAGMVTVASTHVWDLYAQTTGWTPTISTQSGGGTWSTQSTVGAPWYKRSGDTITVAAYCTATLASGTISTVAQINLPFTAATNENVPAVAGNSATGMGCYGQVFGNNVLFRRYDNTSSVVTGVNNIYFETTYKLA